MPSFSGPICRYCRFVTADGLELQGLLFEPGARTSRALLHVHGWNGNCYENRFIEFAARVANRAGYAFFSFNNRGHDYIADILRPASRDYVRLGGIYETIDASIADIAAALTFLARRGWREVVIQGHSHGAIKAAWYCISRPDRRIRGLVLLSPSDDHNWGRTLLGRRFPAALRAARRLVAAGRDRDLLPAELFPDPVSAGTFLDAFGPNSITSLFNFSGSGPSRSRLLGRIRVPVLAVCGTVAEAFVGSAEDYLAAIRAALFGSPSVTTAVIRGAPHNYLGREAMLAQVLSRWLNRQPPTAPTRRQKG